MCILRTAKCILLGSGITKVCTSAGGCGSVHQTSRIPSLPSLPEEEESQQQQYNLDNSDGVKEVSTTG